VRLRSNRQSANTILMPLKIESDRTGAAAAVEAMGLVSEKDKI
jgi:hypothetical protein